MVWDNGFIHFTDAAFTNNQIQKNHPDHSVPLVYASCSQLD